MEWKRAEGSAANGWVVACLCAEWCLTCKGYRATFDAIAGRNPGDTLAWLDVEDDSEWTGDIDVENFPTLLIARDGVVHFFGTVTPHAATLERLLDSARNGAITGGEPDADARALAERLAQTLQQS